ncbi:MULTISPECIES: hypothetical protein [unclassified Moorena]|uniref:hypothetical protein n=1 Tax=unclassified Moorena TaxID=2683338 RepID=UPI00257DB6CC|nr:MULTISPECIES: hypothetical protein [unclassified Moorena]
MDIYVHYTLFLEFYSIMEMYNKLVKVLQKIKPVVAGTGAQTKYNRTKLGFPKEHWIDAACVGDIEALQLRTNQPLLVTCFGQGGRQKAALNKYGYPIRHNPLKPIGRRPRCANKGWCSGDIAKNLLTGEFGRVNPRSKSNSFNYTVPGKKAISLHVKNLIRVHRKDGYTYSFCEQIPEITWE